MCLRQVCYLICLSLTVYNKLTEKEETLYMSDVLSHVWFEISLV